jgi:hypothetical protein
VPLVRRAIACATAAVLATAAFGAAATMALGSDNAGAGADAVTRCDTGGITVSYTGAPSTVTHVVVTGLSSACNGGKAWASVSDLANGNAASGGPAAIAGGTATIDISPDRAAEVVKRYKVAVTGP